MEQFDLGFNGVALFALLAAGDTCIENGCTLVHFGPFFLLAVAACFAQRACTAFRACSLRCAGVRLAARCFPPLRPFWRKNSKAALGNLFWALIRRG